MKAFTQTRFEIFLLHSTVHVKCEKAELLWLFFTGNQLHFYFLDKSEWCDPFAPTASDSRGVNLPGCGENKRQLSFLGG